MSAIVVVFVFCNTVNLTECVVMVMLLGQSEEESTHSYVSLSDLTSYVQQLRSFLPKATMMLRRDHHGTEQVEEEGSGLLEEGGSEDYVTEFLSHDLVADWNKLSPKVL